MKANARWMVALAVISGAWLSGVNSRAASSGEVEEATVMMSSYAEQQKAAAAARAKDPSWKPACQEVDLFQIGDKKNPGALKNFCLDREGNVLACLAPADKGGKPAVRVYSPEGKLMKTLPLEIEPGAICVASDGSIFVGGSGRLLKLDPAGRVLASAESPVASVPVAITKEMDDMLKESEEMLKQSGRTLADERERLRESLTKRRADVTGLAVTERDVFMAVPTPNEFTFRVYRFDHALENPELVVEKLRGCCGQMDLQAHGGNLWIPHNARHMVESRDREGKELSKFGKAGRVRASDFGGCCEPKCMRVLWNGEILAAESGPPTCIKRFSADGKFLGVVAVVDDSKGDCVRVTVDVSPDGNRYYMLDTTRDAIRVFGSKKLSEAAIELN